MTRSVLRFQCLLVHRVDDESGMCRGGAGPHLGRNPDRFHNLLSGRALQCRAFDVAANAVRALRHVRHRNEFLALCGQRAIGKHVLAERLEGGENFRRKILALLRYIFRRGRI